MKDIYFEESIYEVFKYWVVDYKNIGEIVDFVSFTDERSGKVVFRVTVKDEE